MQRYTPENLRDYLGIDDKIAKSNLVQCFVHDLWIERHDYPCDLLGKLMPIVCPHAKPQRIMLMMRAAQETGSCTYL